MNAMRAKPGYISYQQGVARLSPTVDQLGSIAALVDQLAVPGVVARVEAAQGQQQLLGLVGEGVELPAGVAWLPLVTGGLAGLSETITDQDCLVRQVEQVVERGVLRGQQGHLTHRDLTAGLATLSGQHRTLSSKFTSVSACKERISGSA